MHLSKVLKSKPKTKKNPPKKQECPPEGPGPSEMALTPGAGTGDSVSRTKFVVVDAVSSKGNQLFSRVLFFGKISNSP